jgi:fructokinase
MAERLVSPERIVVFGEVLFDCFPDGHRVLGGAPFNVAWHLQALGDAPLLVSRVGADADGEQVRQRMRAWGMDLSGLEIDPEKPTGVVEIALQDGQPRYTIRDGVAYDAIAGDVITSDAARSGSAGMILYHGSLALRSAASRAGWQRCAARAGARFMDINLRPPWWQRPTVTEWLARSDWVKLNEDELRDLGFANASIEQALADFFAAFPAVRQVILTRGAAGALLATADGVIAAMPPPQAVEVVDTVGAGDAFSAMFLHGWRRGWPADRLLSEAQAFASAIVGVRGATPADPAFYHPFQEKD